MNASLESAAQLSTQLAEHGIESILYGSLGVSAYLGPFKQFADVDLLVDPVWLNDRWPELLGIMDSIDFRLVNQREHEFEDSRGLVAALADKNILTRDNVVTSPEDIIKKSVGGIVLTTLSPEAFKRAYEFSRQDGYRRDTRQKKDDAIIGLLDAYIANR